MSPYVRIGHAAHISNEMKTQDSSGDPSAPTTSSGWSDLAKTLKESDETKIRDCKEDIDTLLVFAGLFSAVLTAFVIESYRSLQPDPSTPSIILLDRIASRLDSISILAQQSNFTEPQVNVSAPSSFTPSAAAVRVNSLWFFSLVCSLGTASFSMLIKQWLREYLSDEHASPQAYARVRHRRYKDLVWWKVFEISALLPWLLQISLGSFLLGLTFFIIDIHNSIGVLVAVCVVFWLLSSLATIIMPVICPGCPYKATFFKHTFDSLHRTKMWQKKGSTSVLPRALAEEDAMDVDVLVAADAGLADDEFLGTTIRACFHQMRGSQVLDGVRRIVARRMPPAYLGQFDLLHMTKRGAQAVADILSDALHREVEWQAREMGAVRQWYPWMSESCAHILRAPGYTASALGSVLDVLLKQNDSLSREVVAGLPLRQADEAFLIGTLRACMTRVGGAEVVTCVRQAIIPHTLRDSMSMLHSFEGRAMWQELDWKTRCAFTHILADALNKEVQTQLKSFGDVVRWHAWMTEALVPVTALSTAMSTFGDLLSCLLVQNPVTTIEMLAAFTLNREGSGYGVYCGVGMCLKTEKTLSAVIGNTLQFLQDKIRSSADYDTTQAITALNPTLLCELFTYIGCRCRTTFSSREGLQTSLRVLFSHLTSRIWSVAAQKRLAANAPQAAANCLLLIHDYDLAEASLRSIVPAELVDVLEKVAQGR